MKTELDDIRAYSHCFKDIDEGLILLGSRPGLGKTALALAVAEELIACSDKIALYFSIESSEKALVRRLTKKESLARLVINDKARICITEIEEQIYSLAGKAEEIGIVIVDYLQLIDGSNSKSRDEVLTEALIRLKKLTKELHVPIMVLNQLGRFTGVVNHETVKPRLEDLRVKIHGELSDVVAFLYLDKKQGDRKLTFARKN